MVDPTLTIAVDDSISSSCRWLDGDDDDTSERNSFAPGVSHECFKTVTRLGRYDDGIDGE